MEFNGVKQSKIQWTVVKIKFIKGESLKKFAKKIHRNREKILQFNGVKHYKSGKIHKNREKNLQFNGVKQSKIRWTVVEIKFIKDEKYLKIWKA